MADCGLIGWLFGRQERLVVAREKSSLENAQNAALCSVCRTPVRDTAVNTAPPPVIPVGMSPQSQRPRGHRYLSMLRAYGNSPGKFLQMSGGGILRPLHRKKNNEQYKNVRRDDTEY